MRKVMLLLVVAVLVGGCGSKLKRLTPAEKDHYAALKVWMDQDQRKEYLKLKTTDERNAWLKEEGLWERFYQYDEEVREAILSGAVEEGWSYDQVYMSWGQPHDRKRLTGRDAQRSELLVYRFEVQPDGYVLVWQPKSKTAHKAIDLYRVEVYVDDGVVTELEKKEGW